MTALTSLRELPGDSSLTTIPWVPGVWGDSQITSQNIILVRSEDRITLMNCLIRFESFIDYNFHSFNGVVVYTIQVYPLIGTVFRENKE